MKLKEIYLAFFVENINEDIRKEYEQIYEHNDINVFPVFVETINCS